MDFIQPQVKEMLRQEVISPSKSPWRSPLMIAKKDGGLSLRLCSDLRGVNEVSVGDKFPLSRVENYLEALSGSQFFTMLDAQSGYWQIPMHPDSAPTTAFQAGSGFYQYNVLPFGLKEGPSVFQRIMTNVLG